MRFFIPRVQQFKIQQEMSLQELNCPELGLNQCAEEDPKITLNESETNKEQSSVDIIKSRSKKKVPTNCWEVSFEKHFLESHKSAFQSLIDKYIEQLALADPQKRMPVFHILQQTDANSLKLSKKTFIEIIMGQKDVYSPKVRKQMLMDLQFQQDLAQFIEFIFQKMGLQIGQEMFHLTWLIWEEYLELETYKRSHNKLRNLQIILQDRIQQQSNLKMIKLLFSDFDDERIQLQFMNFFMGFIQTIFLILEGYFQNPNDLHVLEPEEYLHDSFDNSEIFRESWGSGVGLEPWNVSGGPIKKVKKEEREEA